MDARLKIISFIIFIFFFNSVQVKSQAITIHGVISDSESGELLIGVIIHDKVSNKSTLSNEYGYYSLSTVAASVLKSRLIILPLFISKINSNYHLPPQALLQDSLER